MNIRLWNNETGILRNSLFDLPLGSPQNLPRRHVAGRQHDATRSLSTAARERKISPIRSRRAEFGLLWLTTSTRLPIEQCDGTNTSLRCIRRLADIAWGRRVFEDHAAERSELRNHPRLESHGRDDRTKFSQDFVPEYFEVNERGSLE